MNVLRIVGFQVPLEELLGDRIVKSMLSVVISFEHLAVTKAMLPSIGPGSSAFRRAGLTARARRFG